MGTVEHPRIRPEVLEDRLYQRTIAETAVERNALVVLPTGLGKTAIALRVMAEFLLRRPTDVDPVHGPDAAVGRAARPLRREHALRTEPLTLTAPSPRAPGRAPPAAPGRPRDTAGGRERPPDRGVPARHVLPDRFRRGAPRGRRVSVCGDRGGEPPGTPGARTRHDRIAGGEPPPHPRGLGAPRHRAVRVQDRVQLGRRTVPARDRGPGDHAPRSRSRSSTSRSCSAPRSPGRSTCSDGSGSCRPATRVSVPSSRSENGSIGRST